MWAFGSVRTTLGLATAVLGTLAATAVFSPCQAQAFALPHGSLDGDFMYLGGGQALPVAVASAGLGHRVSPLMMMTEYNSIATSSNAWKCSTRALVDGGALRCSYNLSGFTFTSACTSYIVDFGSYNTICSTGGGIGAVEQCSIYGGGSPFAFCSATDASSGSGGGFAYCSSYGSGGTSEGECSVMNNTGGTGWCSADYHGDGYKAACSTGDGSDPNQSCSVVAGSGNSCTTDDGGAGHASCSASTNQQGQQNCSSHAPPTGGQGGLGGFVSGPQNGTCQ